MSLAPDLLITFQYRIQAGTFLGFLLESHPIFDLVYVTIEKVEVYLAYGVCELSHHRDLIQHLFLPTSFSDCTHWLGWINQALVFID